jgi:hypothetical protein
LIATLSKKAIGGIFGAAVLSVLFANDYKNKQSLDEISSKISNGNFNNFQEIEDELSKIKRRSVFYRLFPKRINELKSFAKEKFLEKFATERKIIINSNKNENKNNENETVKISGGQMGINKNMDELQTIKILADENINQGSVYENQTIINNNKNNFIDQNKEYLLNQSQSENNNEDQSQQKNEGLFQQQKIDYGQHKNDYEERKNLDDGNNNSNYIYYQDFYQKKIYKN